MTIDGIIYKSSKEDAGDACAIFIKNKDCCDLGDDGSGAVLVLLSAALIDAEDYI